MNFFYYILEETVSIFCYFYFFLRIVSLVQKHIFLIKKYIDKYINIRYPIICINDNAALAQLVERFHGKEEVAGSSPASGFLKQCNMLV